MEWNSPRGFLGGDYMVIRVSRNSLYKRILNSKTWGCERVSCKLPMKPGVHLFSVWDYPWVRIFPSCSLLFKVSPVSWDAISLIEGIWNHSFWTQGLTHWKRCLDSPLWVWEKVWATQGDPAGQVGWSPECCPVFHSGLLPFYERARYVCEYHVHGIQRSASSIIF